MEETTRITINGDTTLVETITKQFNVKTDEFLASFKQTASMPFNFLPPGTLLAGFTGSERPFIVTYVPGGYGKMSVVPSHNRYFTTGMYDTAIPHLLLLTVWSSSGAHAGPAFYPLFTPSIEQKGVDSIYNIVVDRSWFSNTYNDGHMCTGNIGEAAGFSYSAMIRHSNAINNLLNNAHNNHLPGAMASHLPIPVLKFFDDCARKAWTMAEPYVLKSKTFEGVKNIADLGVSTDYAPDILYQSMINFGKVNGDKSFDLFNKFYEETLNNPSGFNHRSTLGDLIRCK